MCTVMTLSCSQSDDSRRFDRRTNLGERKLEKPLYAAFLEMRNLLEEYAPSWYSDGLRQEVEAIMQNES